MFRNRERMVRIFAWLLVIALVLTLVASIVPLLT